MRQIFLSVMILMAFSAPVYALSLPPACVLVFKELFKKKPPAPYRIIDTEGNYNQEIKIGSLSYQLGMRLDPTDQRARLPRDFTINEFWHLTLSSKVYFVETKATQGPDIDKDLYHLLLSKRIVGITKPGTHLGDIGFRHDVIDHVVGMYIIFQSENGDLIVDLMTDLLRYKNNKEANAIREKLGYELVEEYSYLFSKLDNGMEVSALTRDQILSSLKTRIIELRAEWEEVKLKI